ncbi:MAG: HEAT repeat domain-containing protein, partial [Desulfobulbaceae bacterium]|nr:HEAT repeat domain-containing protein [Desulfobulbaceae bacterium]
MKIIRMLVAVFFVVSSLVRTHAVELSERNDAVIEDQILQGLSEGTWREKCDFLVQHNDEVAQLNFFKNRPEILKRMNGLFEELVGFHNQTIAQYIKNGIKPGDAEDNFRYLHDKDFKLCLYGLASIAWQSTDSEMMPIVLFQDTYYGSEDFSLSNYLYHFGRKAFDVLMEMSDEKDVNIKERVLSHLASWANYSLNEDIRQRYEIVFTPENVLTKEEIEKVQELLFKNINKDDSLMNLTAIYGLKVIARGTKNKIEKQKLLEPIRGFANHNSGSMREAAAEALGEVGEKSDLGILKKMLSDPWVDSSNEKKRIAQIKST